MIYLICTVAIVNGRKVSVFNIIQCKIFLKHVELRKNKKVLNKVNHSSKV